jgi:glycosyltransferase involved in cell wall biosynthesis
MKILQLTVHYEPNVGGVETHLKDLVDELVKKKNEVTVLTYKPLTAKVSWRMFETRNYLKVIRLPWVPGLFYKLVSKPLLEFLYLFPGLFVVTPFIILLTDPEVIHAHGIVAGFIGVFWSKVLGKRVVVSTHSIYHFPKKGAYRNFVFSIFKRADRVLTLSKQSKKEIEKLGIEKNKIVVFTYWIDLNIFKPIEDAKKKVGWKNKFVVLFVGRLVKEKGVLVLLKAARKWNKKITLAIAGTGPLESLITNHQSQITNCVYLGRVENDKLPVYYSAADLVIVPSIHDEGFGRVILESLACGTPVIAANRGAIPETMDNSVGELISVTSNNIKEIVDYFYKNSLELVKMSYKTRKYAERKYSKDNISAIINNYKN